MAIDETDGINVDRIRRTYGYMAPEYLKDGYMSAKADVFSFGVMVLVTITGKKLIGAGIWLKDYIKRKWLEGTLSDIIDPRIEVDSVLMKKFIEIGLLCVQTDATVRPTMEEVVDMLLGTASLTLRASEMRARVLNPEPNFFPHVKVSNQKLYSCLE